MSIGSGIGLLVVGAILAFAVDIPIDWIDLNVVGFVLMGAGALILVLGLVAAFRRRRSTIRTRSGGGPGSARTDVRRQFDDPTF